MLCILLEIVQYFKRSILSTLSQLRSVSNLLRLKYSQFQFEIMNNPGSGLQLCESYGVCNHGLPFTNFSSFISITSNNIPEQKQWGSLEKFKGRAVVCSCASVKMKCGAKKDFRSNGGGPLKWQNG